MEVDMLKRSCTALLLLIGTSGLLLGQVSITGKITGVVTDPTGAVIPGAKVTASGQSLMSPRATISQSDGSYLFDLLPSGSYDLTAAATGFKTFSQKGILLTADSRPR